MVAEVVITDPFANSNTLLHDVDLQSTIKDFKEKICTNTQVSVNEQELMYLGEILEDEGRTLQSYGVQNKTTVYLLKKLEEKMEEADVESAQTVTLEEAKVLLSKAKNSSYKNLLKKLMKNKDSIEKLLEEHEVLRNNYTISGLLRDPDLSFAVLESLTPERIVNEHPMLAVALKIVLSNVSLTDSMGRQTLQQSGHEEDDDYEGLDPALYAQAELMAAAEESIQQRRRQQQTTASSSPSTTTVAQPAQDDGHQISASDLANALSFATMNQSSRGQSSTAQSSTGNRPTMVTPTPDFSDAISQMRATGITDENLCRRALMMSGGNIELALNLIFEGTLDD